MRPRARRSLLLAAAPPPSRPGAVRRMKKLRAAAAKAGMPEVAEALLAELRAKNARRPSLISRMDATGL